MYIRVKCLTIILEYFTPLQAIVWIFTPCYLCNGVVLIIKKITVTHFNKTRPSFKLIKPNTFNSLFYDKLLLLFGNLVVTRRTEGERNSEESESGYTEREAKEEKRWMIGERRVSVDRARCKKRGSESRWQWRYPACHHGIVRIARGVYDTTE